MADAQHNDLLNSYFLSENMLGTHYLVKLAVADTVDSKITSILSKSCAPYVTRQFFNTIFQGGSEMMYFCWYARDGPGQ